MSQTKLNPWENNIENNTFSQQKHNLVVNKSLNDIDFRRLLSIWPYALISAIICFGIGKLYTRYIVTTYVVATKINIQQKEEITIQQAVSGTTRDPFNDRIAYLKSPALSINVVDSLQLMYNTTLIGKFKDKSLYGIIRWRILNPDYERLSENNFNFSILPENGKLQLVYNGKRVNEFVFNKPNIIDGFIVVVDSIKGFNYNSPIICKYIDRWTAATNLSNGLLIKADKESNIIDITYTDISTDRAKDVLNIAVQTYNDILTHDKSLGFSQAINFINGRLKPLASELDSIENDLANYQSNRGFVSENSNGTLYLEKVQEIDKKLIEVDIQKANIDSIEHFVNSNANKDFNYAITGIPDLNLQNSVSLLTQLRDEKEKLATVVTANHPNIKILENNITETKNIIRQQLAGYKKNIDVSRKFCLERISQANDLIKNTPNDEKGLIDIKRMRNIKEALFLALLQKREEASIAKASTTIDTKILSPASIVPSQQKPSKAIILVFSALLGASLPFLFFVCVELLNNKIISKKQLENYLSIPIIAELEFVDKSANNNSNVVIGNKDRSMFGEQLRALRTQLSFYTKESQSLSVMITSNISGEGKSFLSLNLSKSFSVQGKKVALLEFDLRRPKIGNLLHLEKSNGLTNYLLGNLPLDKVYKQPFEDDNNFHFFPAGPIPPNPQELLRDNKMDELREYLQKNYDVIIIDTPPFGIVADAQILGKIVDTTLIVTRFGYTMKEQVSEIEKWSRNNIFPSMSIVLNGVKHKGYYGSKYGYYYYKRKYGYDYYSTKKST
jgi:capsular exopolysaccharide synthesis family protein